MLDAKVLNFIKALDSLVERARNDDTCFCVPFSERHSFTVDGEPIKKTHENPALDAFYYDDTRRCHSNEIGDFYPLISYYIEGEKIHTYNLVFVCEPKDDNYIPFVCVFGVPFELCSMFVVNENGWVSALRDSDIVRILENAYNGEVDL